MLLVRRTLDDARASFPDHAQVVSSLEAPFAAVCANNWSLVADSYRRLNANQSKHPELEYDSAATVLANAATQTVRLHQYLSLLPAGRASRTVHSSLALAFGELFSEILPTVLLLPELTYYEFDLGNWITNDDIFPDLVSPPAMRSKIIRFSAPDAYSPLAWPILAHEFGHAVEQLKSLGEQFKTAPPASIPLRQPSLLEMMSNQYIEYFADSIAARAMGPGMLLALLKFETMLEPLGVLRTSSQTHPSTPSRIQLLAEILPSDVLTEFRPTLDSYNERTTHALSTADPTTRETERWWEQNILVHLRSLAREEAAKLYPTYYGEAELERSRRLASRIGRKIPPCAVRWASKAEIRPLIARALHDRNGDELKSNLVYLGERSASPGEILTAGWIHSQRAAPSAGDLTLREWSPKRSWIENTSRLRELQEYDDLLTSAMETSDIHSYIAHSARLTGELADPPPITPIEGDYREPTLNVHGAVLGDSEIVAQLLRPDDDRLYITPLIDARTQLGPASLDVRLGTNALVIRNINVDCLDPVRSDLECREQLACYTQFHRITPEVPLVLHPGEFALATTLEFLKIPSHLAVRLEGRSSYGRAGLMVHATAGFIDPGYEGTVTFELTNNGKVPIKLYPGARIGQLCFFTSNATVLYSKKHEKKYQGALRTLASRFFEDREYSWMRQRHRETPTN